MDGIKIPPSSFIGIVQDKVRRKDYRGEVVARLAYDCTVVGSNSASGYFRKAVSDPSASFFIKR